MIVHAARRAAGRLVLRIGAACAVAGLVVAAGCGGHASRVSGRVTLDGTALAGGVVTFLREGGGAAAYGTIDADGHYSIRTGSRGGLEPGAYVVTVAANAPPSSAPLPPAGGPKYVEPMLPLITPLQYARQDRTPLRATVVPGGQTLDFELTTK